eukprot:3280171-Amphidinium_carterae.3
MAEAFAAGWSAKGKTAELRKQRGFRPPVPRSTPTSPNTARASTGAKVFRKSSTLTIEQRKARSICAACEKKGHWKGDPVCAKATQSAGGVATSISLENAEHEMEWVKVLPPCWTLKKTRTRKRM